MLLKKRVSKLLISLFVDTLFFLSGRSKFVVCTRVKTPPNKELDRTLNRNQDQRQKNPVNQIKIHEYKV